MPYIYRLQRLTYLGLWAISCAYIVCAIKTNNFRRLNPMEMYMNIYRWCIHTHKFLFAMHGLYVRLLLSIHLRSPLHAVVVEADGITRFCECQIARENQSAGRRIIIPSCFCLFFHGCIWRIEEVELIDRHHRWWCHDRPSYLSGHSPAIVCSPSVIIWQSLSYSFSRPRPLSNYFLCI